MRETDLLDRYLAQERSKPVTWGEQNGDCMLLLLGWGELLGLKASRIWRRTYHDKAGAMAELESFGGAVVAVSDMFGPPAMVGAPKRGDVGLVETEEGLFGAISTGRLLAFRGHRFGYVRLAPRFWWRTGFSA